MGGVERGNEEQEEGAGERKERKEEKKERKEGRGDAVHVLVVFSEDDWAYSVSARTTGPHPRRSTAACSTRQMYSYLSSSAKTTGR